MNRAEPVGNAISAQVSSSFGSRGSQLLLLAAGMAIAGYARTALSALQEAVRIALSLDDNQIAILQGPAIGVPLLLTAIPLGLLIDRHSRARLLFILAVVSLIGSLFTAFASNFSFLLLSRVVAAVAGLSIVPVVFSLLADLFPPAQRGRATTVIIIGQVVGNSAAFALGGALLSAAAHPVEGWRWAMLWLTVPFALVVLLTLAIREPPRSEVSIANPSVRDVWAELLRYRAVIGLLGMGIVVLESAIGAMLIWAAPMLSRAFRLGPDQIGNIMGGGMLLSGVLGPIAGGMLADACQRTGGPRRTSMVLTALALVSAPASLFAFLPGVASTGALLVTAMTTILAAAAMGMTLFTIVIPNELRGLCMSMLMAAIMFFSYAVAPLTVSLLSGAIGGVAMIGKALSLVCVGASFMATAAFVSARRHVPATAVR